jgi:hypothetical protein
MRIATAVAILMLSVLPATASAARESTTPFDLLDDGSLIVPVTIGGTGPYRFMIDTGSSRTVITSRLWQTLRRPVIARTQMVTPSGRTEAYVVRLEGLAVAGQTAVSVDAAVLPAERYAAGQQIDGLIGQDVLASAVYTIDYDRRAIVWHAPGALLTGVRLPLSVRDHRVLVSLSQRDDDPRPLSLIPDSGADGLVLFAHAKDKVSMTPLDIGVLSGLSGTRLVRRAHVESLIVGTTRLQDPNAVVLDTGEAEHLMGDGLLPLHAFSQVTFNVPERYLIVRAR